MQPTAAYVWAPIAFIIGIIFVCAFMLFVPRFLGGASKGKAKQEPFESGIVGVGTSHIRLSAKFYLVAIFFVIFDLEALYLYAYAVSVREVSWVGFIGAFTFIAVLLVGLVYELSLGAMNWSPFDRDKNKSAKPVQPRLADGSLDLAAITAFTSADDLAADPRGNLPAHVSGRMNTHQTGTLSAFNQAASPAGES